VKLKILLIILFLAILPQLVFTQNNFRFGPELGLSVTAKQKLPYSAMKYTQRVRPTFGVSGLLRIKDKFIITSGLQYERAGYFGESTDPSYTFTESSDFQKLCIPLTIGITFNLLKLFPNIFIGYRPNLLLSGEKVINSKAYDLFSDGSTTKRYISQFTFGISAEVLKALRVNLNCSAGPPLEYSFYYYTSSGPLTGRGGDVLGSFKNNQLSLSLTYLFKSKKSAN